MTGQNAPPGTTIATRRSTLYLQRRHALTMLLAGLFGWVRDHNAAIGRG